MSEFSSFKKNIPAPVPLIFDHQLSPTAKIVYLVLTAWPKKRKDSQSDSFVETAIKEIAEKSNLSHQTVVKALNNLERTGWIRRERYSGRPNKYILTTPFFGD